MADVKTIAVAGNPNSGKTTVFNGLTGSRQRIGNWPGVTVEKKEGTFTPSAVLQILAEPFLDMHSGATATATIATDRRVAGPVYRVVDLPGIYSVGASSEDEAVARDYLLSGEADIVVNVVDASNLQRNLFLTLQLLELGLPVIIVLNMMDAAAKKGISIDHADLSRHLGCPVIPTIATNKRDIDTLKAKLHELAKAALPSPISVDYGEEIEAAVQSLEEHAVAYAQKTRSRARWLALKVLEGDDWIADRLAESSAISRPEIDSARETLSTITGDELDVLIADARYGYIRGLSRHISRKKLDRRTATERVDSIVMNRVLAIPVFLAVMYAVFWLTMSVGGAFIDFFDIAVGAIFVDGFAALLGMISAPNWLIGILAHGIGAGIQTVATFVPIIFVMFVSLSILEDSGYMARAAYIMDRFMRAIGLPGKSFVPMMVGFGCTVPAIMSTRTLESARDRFTTTFMAPFMSCGARLPVYALFAAAFFARRSGLVVLSLYVTGIIVSVLTGLLLKLTLFKGAPSHFVMELPAYHAPRPRFVLLQAWQRLRSFVIRAGITITLIVTVLSLMNTFGTDGSIGHDDSNDSVLASVSRTITPVFRPMGITDENWPATVGIFTGVFAKEAVVGTLASIYGQGAADNGEFRLGSRLVEALATVPANLAAAFGGIADPLGAGIVGTEDNELASTVGADAAIFTRLRERFSPAAAYAYLIFVLLYFPCVSALSAAIREMGAALGWVLAAYSTIVAWSVATLFFQIASGPTVTFIVVPLALIGMIIVAFVLLGRASAFRKRLSGAR